LSLAQGCWIWWRLCWKIRRVIHPFIYLMSSLAYVTANLLRRYAVQISYVAFVFIDWFIMLVSVLNSNSFLVSCLPHYRCLPLKWQLWVTLQKINAQHHKKCCHIFGQTKKMRANSPLANRATGFLLEKGEASWKLQFCCGVQFPRCARTAPDNIDLAMFAVLVCTNVQCTLRGSEKLKIQLGSIPEKAAVFILCANQNYWQNLHVCCVNNVLIEWIHFSYIKSSFREQTDRVWI
jgi:hypothetical protein